jgi:pSer/pThr/pTyr-binding forkhead associated (FHA) protein
MRNLLDTDDFREAVSLHHAEVFVVPGPHFFIRDTRSSGGTFRNGMRLSQADAYSALHELKDGDTVQFGSGPTHRPTFMKVEIGGSFLQNRKADVYG